MKFGAAEHQRQEASSFDAPAFNSLVEQPSSDGPASPAAPAPLLNHRPHSAQSMPKRISMPLFPRKPKSGFSDGSAPIPETFLRPETSGANLRQDAKRWAESFDVLLQSKQGVQLFRLFLQREFSDENIEFWLACEEFRHLNNSQQITPRAKQIYTEFVAIQSPKEVNLDSKTREVTMSNLVNPTANSFDQAQARICSLMEKDSYRRFLKSEVYLDLLK